MTTASCPRRYGTISPGLVKSASVSADPGAEASLAGMDERFLLAFRGFGRGGFRVFSRPPRIHRLVLGEVEIATAVLTKLDVLAMHDRRNRANGNAHVATHANLVPNRG